LHKKIYTQMFTEALFTIAKNWKQSKFFKTMHKLQITLC
jgi:hypothetical protein